jgi:SAM-dependent methyltransferase
MRPEVGFVPHPLTGFPYRDLLVLEQLPLGADDVVCEIGTGSGATAARLARLCRTVVGLDVSAAAIARLAPLAERSANLRFVQADITLPTGIGPLEQRFSRVISCDTVEHVAAPGAFFVGLHRLLAPGGRFLVTFPNEPRDSMHGVTRFDRLADLSAALDQAGLRQHRIATVRLTSLARDVANTLGWRPLRLARRLLGRPPASPPPQTFESTWFCRRTAGWQRVAPLVNLYWYAVLRLMAARPPVFTVDWQPPEQAFADGQVLVVGRKPATGAG